MPHIVDICTKRNIPFEIIDRVLYIDILNRADTLLEIPLTFIDNGVEYVEVNGVKRPTCKFGVKAQVDKLRVIDTILTFDKYLEYILFEPGVSTGVTAYSMSIFDILHNKTSNRDSNFVPTIIRSTQRFINNVVNQLPLHQTTMNSWAVNQRIVFIDKEFDRIVDPNIKLQYQLKKADKFFDKGWTLMGLSDSNLSSNNYIFTDDLRKYAPFGIKHHNPQRNLYQTLKMKGDELPAVRSTSQEELINRGIQRTGWNVPTLFIDIPLNFEDQIMIHRDSWKNRSIKVKTVVTIYGSCLVKEGDSIKKGQIVGMHMDGEEVIFEEEGAEHIVTKVVEKPFITSGMNRTMFSVVIESKRYAKEGWKLTNMHGNKGIVRMFDDNYVIHDPVKGDIIPEVVVSFRSITKRKNFGQVAEALASRCTDCSSDKPLVIDDNAECSIEFLRSRLKQFGYDSELVDVETPYGKMKAIWGNVFWGCIKTPEENVWKPFSTWEKDNKGLYKRGLKFSHMEFRSLVTTFGPNNPIIDEVLGFAKGGDYLNAKFEALEINPTNPNLAIIDCSIIQTIAPSSGIMHEEIEFKNTVADPEFLPKGAIIKIPEVDITLGEDSENIITIDRIMLPKSIIRGYWQHKSGLKAVDTIVMALNNVVYYAKNNNKALLAYWLKNYFTSLSKSLGSKSGNIAQIGMAIRYPKSAKATAVVSDILPKNTIEMHTDIARELKVKTGDAVLIERFPCLGFMSLRAQWIKVTSDEDCRYTFRVSNNCLVSQNLDFDGDTLFIAAFHTAEAQAALRKVLNNEDLYVNKVIEKMNNRKTPCIFAGDLEDMQFRIFPKLTLEEHHKIVSRAVGVKAHTGPVIALAYNLMRITEMVVPYNDMKANVDIEVMLDFLGNTVFSQKHGIKALHNIAIDAICTGDVDKMGECGFDVRTSNKVVTIVKYFAAKLGIQDLAEYHKKARENGRSTIINRIVREFNKIYFASRAIQTPNEILEHITADAVDIPSTLFKKVERR